MPENSGKGRFHPYSGGRRDPLEVVTDIYSCYVKFKGLNPRFHVFFVFSRFLNSFLSFEDKNPPSAISCSPFYVKLFLLYFSIKKSDTVIGGGLIIIRSPTRMGPQLVGVGLLCV